MTKIPKILWLFHYFFCAGIPGIFTKSQLRRVFFIGHFPFGFGGAYGDTNLSYGESKGLLAGVTGPNEQEESSTEGKKGGRQKTATDLLELMPPSPIGVWRGRREIASTATACAVGGLRVSLSAPVNFATALLRRSVLERDLPSARRRARYRRWRRGHRQCGRQSCIRRSHGR
jgi:hypothetical protein